MTKPTQQPALKIHRPAFDPTPLADLRRAAIHESGHALALRSVGGVALSISFWPCDSRLAEFRHAGLNTRTSAGIRDAMTVMAAGAAAERLFDASQPGMPTCGDCDSLWEHGRMLHGIAAEPDVIQREIQAATRRATKILTARWQDVLALADSLLNVVNVARSFDLPNTARVAQLAELFKPAAAATTAQPCSKPSTPAPTPAPASRADIARHETRRSLRRRRLARLDAIKAAEAAEQEQVTSSGHVAAKESA